MSLPRLLLFLVASLLPVHTPAQSNVPVVFPKEFSSDQVITATDGSVVQNKIFTDGNRVRAEMTTHGMQFTAIILPAEKKIYQLLPAQSLALEIPYSPDQYKEQMTSAMGLDGTFEPLGDETVENVNCHKYRFTSKEDKKVFFIWVNPADKTPVKMTADDKSFSIIFKDFKPGPQPPALFEVPRDYQVTQMPGLPDNSNPAP